MAMFDIMLGSIIAPKIDKQPIKEAFKVRGVALGSQMPSDAAAQLQSDIDGYDVDVSGEGSSVVFKVLDKDSYFINYLASHDVPVSGGDGGTAHNTDGTTYQSEVKPQLQNTPLPWYMLPVIEVKSELDQVTALMAPDAVRNGASNSANEIEKAIEPQIVSIIGGQLS